MKTKIKRHSRSVLSVVLAVCMLVSCVTVSLIMTDAAQTSQQSATGAAADEAVAAAIDSQPAQEEGAALDTDESDDVSAANSSAVGAKADSESVGAADVYHVKGDFSNPGDQSAWNTNYTFDATTKKVSISLAANTTYNFKIYSTYGSGKWYGANKNYTGTDSEFYFNNNNSTNATIKTTAAGGYVFTLKREDQGDGAVAIAVTYPAAAKTYTVTKAATTNGTFTVSPTTATAGTDITVTAKPNRGYKLKSITATGVSTVNVNVSDNTGTFKMPSQNTTVTVVFETATAYTIKANKVITGSGTINITLTSGGTAVAAATATTSADATLTAYSGEKLTVTATPSSGYQLDTLTANGASRSSGYWVIVSGNIGNITDISATFTTKTYSNQFTATLGDGTDNTYNKVKASFYDYYTDGEFNNGTPNWIKGIKDAERGENQATCTPNNTLNTAIREYTHNNNLPYPLYFGNFLGWSDYAIDSYNSNDEEGWNFYNKVNNSQGLGTPAASYEHYSITGLTGKTLSNGMPTHYKSDETDENGAEMKLFDRSWLSDGAQNGQGELATIIDSPFPVRTKTVTTDGGSHTYYEFDSESDNLWFEGIESRYDNSKVYLDQSACSNDNWYAHFFNNGNTITKDVPMTTSGSYFTATNPDPSTYTKVIFCRMSDGNAPDATWSNVWDQTDTLTYPDGSDNQLLYTLSGYGSGKMNGDWGPYSGVTKNPISPTVNYSTAATDAVYSPNYGNRGFYPFDHKHAGTSSTNNRAWDLGFGVAMEIKFTLGPNGKTADGAEQVFEYSGDDDLWVFVDDQLILDLGGDHKKSTGSINFATKNVTVQHSYNAPNSSATRNSSFTLSNQTVHTMKIFYMERGMFDSNLKFGFSMYPFDDSYEVEKVADVDTHNLNAGLKSQYSDTFTFINTSQNGMGGNAAYKVFDAESGENTRTRTTSEQREFTISNGEIAQFSNVFTENQTLQTEETTSGVYQYDTSYRVVDMQNNEALVKAGDGKNTGTFNFLTTLAGADPDLDITHLRAIFTNTLKTESFIVTKEINDYDDADTAFPFYVTIKMTPGGSLSDVVFNTKDLVYTSSFDGKTHTLGEGGLGMIHEGEYLQFDGIPYGAKVTVYEPVFGTKYTPNTTGNANCYKNVTINSQNSSNAPHYIDRDGNHSDVTIQLKGFDTITIVNEPKNYRMDYELPTRLYGNKIYKLTGLITPAMVQQGYVEINDTDHTAFLTRKFVSDHIPRESIFMKDVIWRSANTDFKRSMTGFDDYVYLLATDHAQTLTVKVDRDGDGTYETPVENLTCGQSILDENGEYITGTNGTPIWWEIYSTDTNQFVTKCYSAELNYVAYDNYSIKAVYGQGTGYDYYDKQVTATVNDLGITRSHWNDTTSGVDDDNHYNEIEGHETVVRKTYNYYKADTEYDRLYLDIELAFESHGKMINTYSASDVKVGYEICILNDNGTVNKVYKDVVLNNTSLNNKNRIHAYYGFKNTEVNRGQNLGIRAYIITEGSTKYSEIMQFELNTEGSKGLSSEYDTTKP